MRETERLSSRSFDPLIRVLMLPSLQERKETYWFSRLGVVGRSGRERMRLYDQFCAHGVLRERHSEVVGVCPGSIGCVFGVKPRYHQGWSSARDSF